jgi:hypothetical protein
LEETKSIFPQTELAIEGTSFFIRWPFFSSSILNPF